MDEQYRLDTPENIELIYAPAGLGSRFLAAAIDTIVLVLMMVVLGIFAFILASTVNVLGEAASSLVIAVTVLMAFLILFGYYTFFELAWNGQSPGKRAVGLRVIRDDGLPLGFSVSIIRNLIRIVDFMPGTYGIGVVTMFLNRRWKRLGDLAAGTIVVRDRGPEAPRELELGAPPDLQLALASQHLSQREYEVVRDYLIRYHELPMDVQHRLGEELGALVEERTGMPRHQSDVYEYLSSVLALHSRKDSRANHP